MRTKIFTSLPAIVLGVLFAVGCGSSSNPSDFFTIDTTILVNGFTRPDPNVPISGQANSPTIFCTEFPNGTSGFNGTSGSNGQFTVNDAALGGPSCSWTITRGATADCPQASVETIFVTVPGGTFNFPCASAINTFTANPARFDPTAPPSSITVTGQNMYPTYAMPQITFYDQNQTALLTVTALNASSDGTSITVPTSQVTFPEGAYGAVISAKQSDGSWLTLGGAGIRLFTPVEPPPKCKPPMPCC